VTATPVTLRRGDAVKIVDGPRTETVPLADWPTRLDGLLDGATNVHLLAPEVADELLVAATFLRRPPPELEVIPLVDSTSWTSSAPARSAPAGESSSLTA